MAKVANLGRARRDRLAEELAARLQADAPNAAVRVEAAPDGTYDGATLDEWRAAARRAGRLVGWPVRTFVSGGPVFLIDNRDRDELSEAEQLALDRRVRAAVNAMDVGPAPPPR